MTRIAPRAYGKGGSQVGDDAPPLLCRHHLRPPTSLSIALSSTRSATSLFQAAVLIFEPAEAFRLDHQEATVRAAPAVVCLLRDAVLPADLGDLELLRRRLVENRDDLLSGEARLRHESSPARGSGLPT